MTRRIALAVSLAFTTVVVFAVVALGGQAGLFMGGGGESEAAALDEKARFEMAAAKVTQPTPTVAPEAPPVEPQIITEYIYIDEPAPAPEQVAPARAPAFVAAPPTVDAGSPDASASSGSGSSSNWDDDDDEHDDDDHEKKHHDDDDDDDDHDDHDDHDDDDHDDDD